MDYIFLLHFPTVPLGLRSVQLGCIAFPLFPSLSLAFFLFNSSLTYENKEKEDKSGANLPYHHIANARCCNFANVKPKQLTRLLLMARTYNRGGLHRYTLRSKRQADKTQTRNDKSTKRKHKTKTQKRHADIRQTNSRKLCLTKNSLQLWQK